MRILLTFSLLLLLGQLAGQLEVHVTSGFDELELPSSRHRRVAPVGSNRLGDTSPRGFFIGVEFRPAASQRRFPIAFGIKHGIVFDMSLSADFSGSVEECAPFTESPTLFVAQARLQGANYWQMYGSVEILKIPKFRQMRLSVGGGLLVFSRQRVHEAVSQINLDLGIAEVPVCPFSFEVVDGVLQSSGSPDRRLDLGQKMLRPVSAYAEVSSAFSIGHNLESFLALQGGVSRLIDPALYGDRVVGDRWFALRIGFRGRVL